ncbi:transmembrane anterior posterior transformation protein 1-like isoform X2 [Sycon ciliatum]|uniref:transmembrane anterior posterior transformation protein 1-like isoform X2 n=1 Tax=Sycon ciliatum TaxID=27933 RepID=UPI0031F63B18
MSYTRKRLSEAHHIGSSSSTPPIGNPVRPLTLRGFLFAELTRGYLSQPSQDESDSFAERRERVYTFMKTPRELEKLILFGFALCLDAFLFVFTFLPIRALLALGSILFWPFYRHKRLLQPGQIHDLLRVALLMCCCYIFLMVDGSMLYHMVRGQSVIKIYVMFNILDIGDKLLASFGQDTLDALYWTATEKHARRREHAWTVCAHYLLAMVYILLHSTLVFFQAITLNVAINSHNQSLFTVVVSNQFVELKGSAFKKFEKNNLFQMSCSDIRERFHQFILLLVVILRNMTDVFWNLGHLRELVLPLAIVCCSEVMVDWIKHAFITKFNSISSTVYKEYRLILARDVADSRHHLPAADHCDLVSRRMGFIPLPLAVLLIRVICNSITSPSHLSPVFLVIAFLCDGSGAAAITAFLCSSIVCLW